MVWKRAAREIVEGQGIMPEIPGRARAHARHSHARGEPNETAVTPTRGDACPKQTPELFRQRRSTVEEINTEPDDRA